MSELISKKIIDANAKLIQGIFLDQLLQIRLVSPALLLSPKCVRNRQAGTTFVTRGYLMVRFGTVRRTAFVALRRRHRVVE